MSGGPTLFHQEKAKKQENVFVDCEPEKVGSLRP